MGEKLSESMNSFEEVLDTVGARPPGQLAEVPEMVIRPLIAYPSPEVDEWLERTARNEDRLRREAQRDARLRSWRNPYQRWVDVHSEH